MAGIITLTTDFGLSDGYVGAMHGVIASLNPEARIVDITHRIGRQDVRQAAYVLQTVYPYFPKDVIHVVVVDPGVGSERRAIALRTHRACFVAPDNGVLSYIAAGEPVLETVELTNPSYWLPEVSSTFHGRDIFAPVAAHLSLAVPLSSLGRPVTQVVTFPMPEPRLALDGVLHGHVLHVDSFGNVITDIREDQLAGMKNAHVRIAGRSIEGIGRTYATGEKGTLVALVGSAGFLEIAVREGNARATLGVTVGMDVLVDPR